MEFVNALINKASEDLLQNITMPAEIIALEEEGMKATVQPLLTNPETEEPWPTIASRVITGQQFHNWTIKYPYKVGDLVIIAFSLYDSSKALTRSGRSNRQFSKQRKQNELSNCYILAPYGSNDSTNSGVLEFDPAGESIKMIFGTTEITFSAMGMTINIAGVMYNATMHTHSTPVGPSGVPLPG